jgi:hypothetical protein
MITAVISTQSETLRQARADAKNVSRSMRYGCICVSVALVGTLVAVMNRQTDMQPSIFITLIIRLSKVTIHPKDGGGVTSMK